MRMLLYENLIKSNPKINFVRGIYAHRITHSLRVSFMPPLTAIIK